MLFERIGDAWRKSRGIVSISTESAPILLFVVFHMSSRGISCDPQMLNDWAPPFRMTYRHRNRVAHMASLLSHLQTLHTFNL